MKMTTVSCHICGIDFLIKPSHLVRRPNPTCSRACKGKSRSDINAHSRKPLAERFWERVDKSGDCWIWTGTIAPSGYGMYEGLNTYRSNTHRTAWELTYGPIPSSDIFVCHACDNRPCVRPSHLFLGSQSDNMLDAGAKGRIPGNRQPLKGEKHGNAKLTESDVRRIRQLIDSGETDKTISSIFNISPSNISLIRRGKAWRHTT